MAVQSVKPLNTTGLWSSSGLAAAVTGLVGILTSLDGVTTPGAPGQNTTQVIAGGSLAGFVFLVKAIHDVIIHKTTIQSATTAIESDIPAIKETGQQTIGFIQNELPTVYATLKDFGDRLVAQEQKIAPAATLDVEGIKNVIRDFFSTPQFIPVAPTTSTGTPPQSPPVTVSAGQTGVGAVDGVATEPTA